MARSTRRLRRRRPPGYGGLSNCFADGEASAAVKQQVDAGPAIISLVGYGLVYNTLDNNKNPTRGLLAEFRQDFAGLGGDVNFIRTTGDARYYYELMSDIVSVLRLQGGHVTGWGSKDLRMLDHFQMGPNLVRGFQTAGIGPRDLTLGTTQDALGGTMYWGASLEVQVPIFGVPKDFGMRLAFFADAGSVWGYKGPTIFPATGLTVTTVDPITGKDTNAHDGALLGRRRPDLGFAVRSDPHRLCVPDHQGSERPDPGAALQRRDEVLASANPGFTRALPHRNPGSGLSA